MKKDLKEELLIKFYIWYLKFNKVEIDYHKKEKSFRDVYLFKNREEYLKYLIDSGVDVDCYPNCLIESPIIYSCKDSYVLVFKGVCDKLIFTLSTYEKLPKDESKQKIIEFRKR